MVTDRTGPVPYGVEDLNRVGAKTLELYNLLNAAGYIADVGDIKTDWIYTDFPTSAQLSAYLDNIQALVDIYYNDSGVELPDDMHTIDYNGENNIEKVLESIDKLYKNMVKSYRKAGRFKSGQGVKL